MNEAGLTYEQSGVSIEAQDQAIDRFKSRVEASHAAAFAAGAGKVVTGIGSFGAAFAPDLSGIKQPLLISSTDGIGTKVRLHARFGTHAWAGRDLVSATVNDVLCQGAKPLFFLDYLACHKVDPAIVVEVVGGMAETCTQIGCALIGGEIAEMGETYHLGEYDLAGCAVGLVDADAIWGPERVREGDVLIGIASSGVHCNGFALVRQVFEMLSDQEWNTPNQDLNATLKEALLEPTLCYAGALEAARKAGLAEQIHAAAHISGGGLPGNMPRSVPVGLCAEINRIAVRDLAAETVAVFDIIERYGRVDPAEMWRVFNMGVGFVLLVTPTRGPAVIEALEANGYRAAVIGAVMANSVASRFDWSD